MALSLNNLVRKRSEKPPVCVFYGPPGIGKTSFAAEFPSPIFIQTEDGTGNLEITSFSERALTSAKEVDEAIELLLNEPHDFKTVVLDSLDWFEPLLWAATCKRNGWKSLDEPGYGKGYNALEVDWRYFLSRMTSLRDERGMTVIMLAHEQIVSFADPARDSYDRYQLRLHKKTAPMVVESADVVGFLNYVTLIRKESGGFGKETAKATGGGQRVLNLAERPAFTAKNRFDLPDQILISKGQGYAALAPYLPGHRQSVKADAA